MSNQDQNEFDLFKHWIHAVVDRKIAEAFGQPAEEEIKLEASAESLLISTIDRGNH